MWCDRHVRLIDADEVRRRLDLDTAYRSQVEAFRCLGTGVADLPERLILDGTGGDAVTFCYAARLRPGTGAVCKFGAVAAGNAARGLPSVHALVLALHPTTGEPVALLDGEAITERRTAAASALAVDRLAAADASTLAVVGCGLQGRAHARALARRRAYRRIWLADHTPAHAAAAAADLSDLPVAVAPSIDAAAADADILILCTTSSTPVLSAASPRPGTTVLSIGSFERGRHEVAPSFVAGADRVVVDHLPSALRQAGPIVAAAADGTLDPESIVDLGAVVAGDLSVRRSPGESVFYNSVGVGVQDAAAVWAVLHA
jgi:ornithine cyclodeaminase/alanine dehydrogenase-like protein (mu-crystallin family)